MLETYQVDNVSLLVFPSNIIINSILQNVLIIVHMYETLRLKIAYRNIPKVCHSDIVTNR